VLKACSARIVTLNHFLTLLESRIDSLLIRLNWVYSKHMIRQILRKRWFLVNGMSVTYPNYVLTNFDCLSVDDLKKKEIFEYLEHRLEKKDFFYRPPFYLEVNYKTLTCFIIRKLFLRDI
jgi:ribosomal protein S4